VSLSDYQSVNALPTFQAIFFSNPLKCRKLWLSWNLHQVPTACFLQYSTTRHLYKEFSIKYSGGLEFQNGKWCERDYHSVFCGNTNIWPCDGLNLQHGWVPGILLDVNGGPSLIWRPYRHLWADCLDNVIFLHPVAHNIVRSFSSVFVRHVFNYPNYFKTLKHLTFFTICFGLYDHHQVLKLRFEEVAAFLGRDPESH
jgi:hypothetical protein